MRRRFPVGLVLAVLFTLGNLAGGIYAGMMGEVRHAGLHVVLTLVGAWAAWALNARRRIVDATPPLAAVSAGSPGELVGRLRNLEQSLDAIAVEVERVGEGQRFMTRLFRERNADEREPKQPLPK